MKKLYWCLIGVPLLVGLASYSIAQPGGGKRGGGRIGGGNQGFAFWKVEKIVEQLEITPAQALQLDEIDYKFRMDSIDPEARMKKARLEMDHLISQEAYSEQDVNRLVDEISTSSTEMVKLGLHRQIAIRGVLTPEQWSQLDQMRESRSKKMRMRGKGQGGEKGRHRHGGDGEGMNQPDQDEGEGE